MEGEAFGLYYCRILESTGTDFFRRSGTVGNCWIIAAGIGQCHCDCGSADYSAVYIYRPAFFSRRADSVPCAECADEYAFGCGRASGIGMFIQTWTAGSSAVNVYAYRYDHCPGDSGIASDCMFNLRNGKTQGQRYSETGADTGCQPDSAQKSWW